MVPGAVPYDEFALLPDNAAEVGLAWKPPTVERISVDVGGGQQVSALRWGTASPEIVLVHGGAQNAHTWDTVALALDRPLVAVDLPGHGHSDWRDDHDYSPRRNAEALETALPTLAPDARLVVGMSLGGLSCLALSARAPRIISRLVLVDVTPGTDRDKAEPVIAFIAGPERFDSFDDILARTMEYNPTRTESSLRRGILHNAYEDGDGTWVWRYDRTWSHDADSVAEAEGFAGQWGDVDSLTVPTMLVRGALSGVVGDEDVVEMKRRKPDVRIEVVEGAGHSVQGDKPLELAGLIESFLDD